MQWNEDSAGESSSEVILFPRGQDVPCVLKIALSDRDQQKLRKERAILETIRHRDRLGEAPRYLVHPSTSWSPRLLGSVSCEVK
jgi:hypothetical protein